MAECVQKLQLPVSSYRTFPNPYGASDETPRGTYHIAIVDVDLLDVEISTKPNLRETNLDTKPAGAIDAGLTSPDGAHGFFHIANRGILLAVEQAEFDNQSSILTLNLPHPKQHGVLDGGHTYEIIRKAIREERLANQQYVKIEILAGFEEDVLHYIAQARNTSVQVSNASIAEHESKFEPIKQAIGNQPYFDSIRFKDNTGSVDVREITSLLLPFHPRYQSSDNQPVHMYSGKERCLKEYLDEVSKDGAFVKPDGYAEVLHLLPDILRLHDQIIERMPEFYNRVLGGKLGARREIIFAQDKKGRQKYVQALPFSYGLDGEPRRTQYGIPRGIVFPVLASLRVLVGEPVAGKRNWRVDPFEFYSNAAGDLVREVFDQSGNLGQNPNALGKNIAAWRSIHRAAKEALSEYK